jgi:myo-inositol-1(or 4)-monophosphatase
MEQALAALAAEAARAAGDVLLRYARGATLAVRTKSSATDLVTDADHAAEEAILAVLRAARPEDAVLSEESGATPGTSGLRWLVDPLDGTTNFVWARGDWAVSIACEDAEGLVAACVLDPVRDELFTAARGAGTTLNGRAVQVSAADDLGLALVATGFGYEAAFRREQALLLVDVIEAVRDVRRLGSAALDLAWVACGRLDGYYEVVAPWDRAAGELLVREAGGRVVLEPGPGGRPQTVAANSTLLPQLARLVSAPPSSSSASSGAT